MKGIQLAADVHKDIAQKVEPGYIEGWKARVSSGLRSMPQLRPYGPASARVLSPVSKSACRKGGWRTWRCCPGERCRRVVVPQALGRSWNRNVRCIVGVRGPGKPWCSCEPQCRRSVSPYSTSCIVRASVMLLVDSEQRREPLGKYLRRVPEEAELVGCPDRSTGGVPEGRKPAVLRNAA